MKYDPSLTLVPLNTVQRTSQFKGFRDRRRTRTRLFMTYINVPHLSQKTTSLKRRRLYHFNYFRQTLEFVCGRDCMKI